MQLLSMLFAVYVYVAGSLPAPPHPQVSLDIAQPQCTHMLPALVVAAQAYDMVNTHNQMVRYPAARETDWWSRMFSGPGGRSVVGITLGVALLDEIKWRLSSHSPALRCGLEAQQLETTIDAIRISQPH